MAGGEFTIVTLPIRDQVDVVSVRQRAKRIAELVGFDQQDQTRIATAVSEVARNAHQYASNGKASFTLRLESGHEDRETQTLVVTVSDTGLGIADLDAIMAGRHRSEAGAGLGLIGAKRLVDRLSVETGAGQGSKITLEKRLSRCKRRLGPAEISNIGATLSEERPIDPFGVLAEQNYELIQSLNDVKTRQEELAQLNQELEDTNRGVVALYGELDSKADQLREASELKSRFLSNVSHEFRTPLNSILALSQLLLDRVDGELTSEQERQVNYIRRSAESLAELANDLLDLAKVEAGKVEIRPSQFAVADLLAALRGVLKPLRSNDTVALNFVVRDNFIPDFHSDETKVTQILRNLISNALKFTLEGHVSVSARYDASEDLILFEVSDTGVGIAPEDQARIFEEFAQVNNPLQRANRGTGLGLPLARQLAELLGGELSVESETGKGSVFKLVLPRILKDQPQLPPEESDMEIDAVDPSYPLHILVIDDDEAFRYVLRQSLEAIPEFANALVFHEAGNGDEGLRLALSGQPMDVILLDLQMDGLNGYDTLQALSTSVILRQVPVVVMTSTHAAEIQHERLRQARSVFAKDRSSLHKLEGFLRRLMANRRTVH